MHILENIEAAVAKTLGDSAVPLVHDAFDRFSAMMDRSAVEAAAKSAMASESGGESAGNGCGDGILKNDFTHHRTGYARESRLLGSDIENIIWILRGCLAERISGGVVARKVVAEKIDIDPDSIDLVVDSKIAEVRNALHAMPTISNIKGIVFKELADEGFDGAASYLAQTGFFANKVNGSGWFGEMDQKQINRFFKSLRLALIPLLKNRIVFERGAARFARNSGEGKSDSARVEAEARTDEFIAKISRIFCPQEG